MTTLTLTKKKPAEVDFAAVKTLADVPAVHAAAVAARQAQTALDELAAQARVLDGRAANSDPLTRMEAQLEFRRLAPELRLAELRAVSTHRASEAARETAIRAILDAQRPLLEARLRRMCAKWAETEAEVGDLLAWLHALAAVIGYGATNHWFELIPPAFLPGAVAEYRGLCPGHVGLEV